MPFIRDTPPPPPQLADSREERRRAHHEADVVIVGGGIAGCATAVALSNEGRSVILLERSLKEPDRIVGELLQPGGIAALKKLGLSDSLEGIDAVIVRGYDVIYYGAEVEIPYPKEAARINHVDGVEEVQEKGDEREGRPEGRSFHHGRFVQKLRAAAMTAPNVTVVESTVTGLVKCGYTGQVLGVESTTKGEEDYVRYKRGSTVLFGGMLTSSSSTLAI